MILNNKLSGGARDVLYALFFRGALPDGDLPSKNGANELRELGFMRAQKTAVSPGEYHRNFLTPSGQEFAIAYLADSHFGSVSSSSFEAVVKPVIKWLITHHRHRLACCFDYRFKRGSTNIHVLP